MRPLQTSKENLTSKVGQENNEQTVKVTLNQIPLRTSSGPENLPHFLVQLGTSVTVAIASPNLSANHLLCFLFYYFDPQHLKPCISLYCFAYFGLTPLLLPGCPFKEEQERDLKAALKGTDPSIPLVFVSGNHDLGNTPTPSSVEQYCNSWGDDYFSFWVNRRSIDYVSRKWMMVVGLDVKVMALAYLRVCSYMLNLSRSLQFTSHSV